MDDAGTGEVVHERAGTSYTALLFLVTALCGVLNITPRLLYSPVKRTPCTHWERSCVGPLAGLDVFGERKPHYAPGIDSVSNRNECREYFLVGKRHPVCRADNLITNMCRLSVNLGATPSWNPLSLTRPVQVLLYLDLQGEWVTKEMLSIYRYTPHVRLF